LTVLVCSFGSSAAAFSRFFPALGVHARISGGFAGEEGADHRVGGAAAPLARVLDKLADDERTAFLKAMDMLEAEFHAGTASPPGRPPAPARRESAGRSQPVAE
jgi:hypothetical protein